MKIKRICKTCGKEFEVFPSRIKNGGALFCSYSCSSKSRVGESNSNWKGGEIERISKQCGRTFHIKRYSLRNGDGVYCSRSCARKAQNYWHIQGKNNHNWKGGKVERVCQICGKTFKCPRSLAKNKKYGLYCSKSCAQKGVWENKDYKRIDLVCPICGKRFAVIPSRLKRTKTVYCSVQCAQEGLAKATLTSNTKPEKIFKEICKKYNLPFKHVADRSFWIGNAPRVNPDFVHINNKRKICVEVFGAFWHNSMLNQKIPYERTYNGRKALLKSYGWKMIGIWDHDLLRKDAEQFVLYTLKKHNIFPSTT